MIYLVNNNKYSLSYQELKEQYLIFCDILDNEFLDNLPQALHIACMICYLKEINTENCLSDEGIIHQLIHLLDIPDESIIDIKKIRQLFKEQLKLV